MGRLLSASDIEVGMDLTYAKHFSEAQQCILKNGEPQGVGIVVPCFKRVDRYCVNASVSGALRN